MAKSKNADGVPNRNLYTRISYLHQAASYLAVQATKDDEARQRKGGNQGQSQTQIRNTSSHDERNPTSQNVARHLVTELRTVSRKALIRPSPQMKQTLCKLCDTVLIEGDTCTTVVENPSKSGKKPWADVMVIRCKPCGHVKRFPVGQARQKRRSLRGSGQMDQG